MKKRTCPCGRAFIASSPRHDRCRSCHRARCQEQDRRIAARRSQKEREAERESVRESLREAFLNGTLPASARVHRLGSQVAVAWMGRSYTFHLGTVAA